MLAGTVNWLAELLAQQKNELTFVALVKLDPAIVTSSLGSPPDHWASNPLARVTTLASPGLVQTSSGARSKVPEKAPRSGPPCPLTVERPGVAPGILLWR